MCFQLETPVCCTVEWLLLSLIAMLLPLILLILLALRTCHNDGEGFGSHEGGAVVDVDI